MEVIAKLRYYRQSPRKVRLVTSFLHGSMLEDALINLRYMTKRAAQPIIKLIESAKANAIHNFSLDPKNLYVKSIIVDTGPTIKKWRARAFGKAATIRKRTSHVTVTLAE